MKHTREFPFERSRRLTAAEVEAARKAIEEKSGEKRKSRGRPPKSSSEKYSPVSIRLHPKVLAWVKKEAKKQGVGYQSLINDILFQLAA